MALVKSPDAVSGKQYRVRIAGDGTIVNSKATLTATDFTDSNGCRAFVDAKGAITFARPSSVFEQVK